MVEGGMKCVKVLLFGFNLVFVVAAICLIAVGAYVQINLKDYFDLIEGSFSSAAALLIAVGVIIFFIAFFGCCGAYRENHFCVMTFAGLLIIIFILEIAGGITGFVFRNQVNDTVNKYMKETIQKNETKAWDKVQDEFKCCGVHNYTDWNINNSTYVPTSCCKLPNSCDTTNPADLYSEGCLDKLTKFVEDKIVIIGGIGIGLAFVQIVGIMFACCLARAIKKEYEVV